ncbi:hypothetical protein KH5_21340 [Urechidicola sp. KH5]
MSKSKAFLLLILIFVAWSCTSPKPRRPIAHRSDSFFQNSVALNKRINEAQTKAISEYIVLDSLISYTISPQGFWYASINENNESRSTPTIGDEVLFEYEIFSMQNQLIYGKSLIGLQVYTIDKQEMEESGLQNGLKLMQPGEEFKFIFPSFQAYGFAGDQEKIGINQPLIYYVKLIEINKKDE